MLQYDILFARIPASIFMTTTQQFIDTWQFDYLYRVLFHSLQNNFRHIGSWHRDIDLFFSSSIFVLAVFFLFYIFRKVCIMRNNVKQKRVLLEITPPAYTEKTAYTTKQLFSVIHNSRSGNNFFNWVLGKKTTFSFEIVSTKEKGIRYLVHTDLSQKENMKRNIVSYLPGSKVQQVTDYLSKSKRKRKYCTKIIELQLASNYAYPLEKQNALDQHDPVAYITGMMTKLTTGEIISLQIVLSPTKVAEVKKIANMILRQEDVLLYLDTAHIARIGKFFLFLINGPLFVVNKVGEELQMAVTELFHGRSRTTTVYAYDYAMQQHALKLNRAKPMRQLSSFEQEVIKSVQEKIDQPLFESMIRIYVAVQEEQDLQSRLAGLQASFAPFSVPQYQSLKTKWNFPPFLMAKIKAMTFRKRLLSLGHNSSASLLSVSEVADLYHFPFSSVTQTENIVKTYFKELPAPLSLKNGRKMEVIFGNNMFGGVETPIGLTSEERETHMFIIGRTGSGKTTMLFSLCKQDIENGQGIAFIDPHGDVSEDILTSIPEDRKDDVIYFNPIDVKYPIGINILELSKGLDTDEAELEKEVVAEGVISLFRKVFSKEENVNAHRIEYILRNCIYTAFTLKDPTIFTLYDLLNNPEFRKQAIKHLTDENLKNFWKNEFGKAGDYQVIKMTGGVTAKIGRFLFSPTAKRILEQKQSTINFDEILNSGKILLCNLSQGKLGEDTSRVLGITIVTKLQQAALKRAYMPEEKRKPFFLYVDEFQNFATQSFTKMMSEGRKYKLRLIIAEQSTSQQDDGRIINIILANVTTVVVFRSANPIDENFMLAQFSPYIQKGDIGNLPKYHYYIKVSALDPEEPFSGKTISIPPIKDEKKMDALIQASRKNNAIEYVWVEKTQRKEIENVVQPRRENLEYKASPTRLFPGGKQTNV